MRRSDACGGCGTWNFDAGTDAQGWMAPTGGSNSVTAVLTSTSMKRPTGTRSLAVSITGTGSSTNGWVAVRLCQSSQPLNGNALTATAWVYLATNSTIMFPSAGIALSSDGGNAGISGQRMATSSWIQLQSDLSGSQGNYLVVTFSNAGPFSGTLYIDEVAITGP